MNNSSAVYRSDQTRCSSSVSETVTVILSTVSLLALTGNSLVILTFIKSVNLKTSSNYYIVNMAASDLVCVLLNWPLYATEGMLKPGGSLITNSAFATICCKMGIYSRSVSYVVSILSLMRVAVDRFIVTAFPLKALNISRKPRIFFLVISWLLPGISLVPYLFYTKIVEIENQTFCRNLTSGYFLRMYYTVAFVLFYCAPLISILILYPLIMKHLRTSRLDNRGGRTALASKRLKQSRNIMKIFGSIVLTFFICWTPHYVYLFLKSFYPSIFLKDKCLFLVGLFYYLFPSLSTVTNPFILMLFSTSYREAVKSL
ncbi:unnamed protein product, partial [Porites lobata]